MINTNAIYNEDCLIGMEKLMDKSVDLILTDLPYCRWHFDKCRCERQLQYIEKMYAKCI